MESGQPVPLSQSEIAGRQEHGPSLQTRMDNLKRVQRATGVLINRSGNEVARNWIPKGGREYVPQGVVLKGNALTELANQINLAALEKQGDLRGFDFSPNFAVLAVQAGCSKQELVASFLSIFQNEDPEAQKQRRTVLQPSGTSMVFEPSIVEGVFIQMNRAPGERYPQNTNLKLVGTNMLPSQGYVSPVHGPV